jgi:hypothetical protein
MTIEGTSAFMHTEPLSEGIQVFGQGGQLLRVAALGVALFRTGIISQLSFFSRGAAARSYGIITLIICKLQVFLKIYGPYCI